MEEEWEEVWGRMGGQLAGLENRRVIQESCACDLTESSSAVSHAAGLFGIWKDKERDFEPA